MIRKQLRLGKKAADKEFWWMFARMIIIMLVSFTMFIIVKKHIVATEDISMTESSIYMYTLLASPNGFSYVDEDTGRVVPYTIDISKYTIGQQKRLEDLFYFDKYDRMMTLKMSLYDEQGKPYFGDPMKDELYYNERYYSSWKDMANAKFVGSGSYTENVKTFYVRIFDSLETKGGFVEVSIVLPKS